jgi:hypothetical protein
VLYQRAETGIVLSRRVLGEEPQVLPYGEKLAQHHQAGHHQGPYGEPADRIGPRAERRDEEQDVRRADRQVGQRADRPEPGERHRGGLPPSDGPAPIELGTGDQHHVADQEDGVGPTRAPAAHLELHNVEREVRDHPHRHTSHQQGKRQPVAIDRAAEQHRRDPEQHQHARQRIGERHQGDDEAALL